MVFRVDITEGIPKQSELLPRVMIGTRGGAKVALAFVGSVSFCRNCDRFLSPPGQWTIAQPESRELLAICLKKLKGLNKVRLVDAGFIWTEPHSKRIKVKLTIQKEVRVPIDYSLRCSSDLAPLGGLVGVHLDCSSADIPGGISCAAWSVSGLHQAGGEEYVESVGPSTAESIPQTDVLVSRAAYS